MLWLLLIIIPYFLIYLSIFRGLIKIGGPEKLNQTATIPYPDDSDIEENRLTVIIPLKNEVHNISALIKNLYHQSYPARLTEVILVDDRSSDNTFNAAVKAAEAFFNCKVYHSTGSGKKDAVSFGIKQSTGDLIITTDADCRFGPEWLKSIEQTWISFGADVIIGPVYMEAENKTIAPFIQLEHISVQAVTIATALLGRPVMASAANLAFTKNISDRYDNYIRSEILSGDDMFLLHYAKSEKRRVVLNNYREGIVKTTFEGSMKEFLLQRSRWSGKGRYYNDIDTILLGAVTALTNFGLLGILFASFFKNELVAVVVCLYLLKSIPDILILSRMTWYLKRLKLMFWFIPLQLVYPFYVALVTLSGLLFKPSWPK